LQHRDQSLLVVELLALFAFHNQLQPKVRCYSNRLLRVLTQGIPLFAGALNLTLKDGETKAEPHQACAPGGVLRFGVP
jgi:hypothetical protein